MNIHGIYASEWEKFHPEQFVNIWQFQDYIRLNIWGTTTASSIPEYLGDEDLDDFVLEPINEVGEAIPLPEAIARRNELERITKEIKLIERRLEA